MARKLLIDANHPEEIRVATVDGNTLEDFEAETSTKKQIKGDIYLGKVIRIEPSLQAAFVDFGGNRHGFLPFNEIHPDYFKLKDGQKDAKGKQQPDPAKEQEDNPFEDGGAEPSVNISADPAIDENDFALEDDEDVEERQNVRFFNYKIQDVLARNQIVLVQVVKEERGGKGSALTTYLSLPGRYCIFMPNSGHRDGGVSRKIVDLEERRRLKTIIKSLDIEKGKALIVRTAGKERSKLEIRKDYEYLMRCWREIRDNALSSIAPIMVNAEADIIKKSLRDNYSREIEEVLVQGEAAYKQAKDFMKQLMPSHARKVKLYNDPQMPLLSLYKVEEQVDKMMQPSVALPSGGYIVINPTEALVAIDVNSGRSTREKNIDETALKTNLEAADEIARQMRLRNLAGLVVIDFIDMMEGSHNALVEKRLRDALKKDRAKIQLGKISQFGLLELSRQRMRPSILEAYTLPCAHCSGTGLIRSIESLSLHILREVENAAIQKNAKEILLSLPDGVDLYLLNQKRQNVVGLEKTFDISLNITRDHSLKVPDFNLDVVSYKDQENQAWEDSDAKAAPNQTNRQPEQKTYNNGTGNSERGDNQKRNYPRENKWENNRDGRRDNGREDSPVKTDETNDNNQSSGQSSPQSTVRSGSDFSDGPRNGDDDNGYTSASAKRRNRRRRKKKNHQAAGEDFAPITNNTDDDVEVFVAPKSNWDNGRGQNKTWQSSRLPSNQEQDFANLQDFQSGSADASVDDSTIRSKNKRRRRRKKQQESSSVEAIAINNNQVSDQRQQGLVQVNNFTREKAPRENVQRESSAGESDLKPKLETKAADDRAENNKKPLKEPGKTVKKKTKPKPKSSSDVGKGKDAGLIAQEKGQSEPQPETAAELAPKKKEGRVKATKKVADKAQDIVVDKVPDAVAPKAKPVKKATKKTSPSKDEAVSKLAEQAFEQFMDSSRKTQGDSKSKGVKDNKSKEGEVKKPRTKAAKAKGL